MCERERERERKREESVDTFLSEREASNERIRECWNSILNFVIGNNSGTKEIKNINRDT